MLLTSWIDSWCLSFKTRRQQQVMKTHQRRRLRSETVEALEDRTLLAADLLAAVRDLGDYSSGSSVAYGYYTWHIDTDSDSGHEIDRIFGQAKVGIDERGRRDVPVVGDWDNDGFDDFGVVRQEPLKPGQTQQYLRWYRDTDGDAEHEGEPLVFGLPGDTPIVGNWDGIGVDDPGVVRTQGTQLVWYFDTSSSSLNGDAERSLTYGPAGATPISGDWDGNGTTDVGYVKRVGSSWEWHIRLQTNGILGFEYPTTTFGASSMIPVVGNWNDNDSADNFGYVDPSTSPLTWYLDTDGNYSNPVGNLPIGVNKTVQFGLPASNGRPADIVRTGLFRQSEIEVFKGNTAVIDKELLPAPIVQEFGETNLGQAEPSITFQVNSTGNQNLTVGGLTVPNGYEIVEGLTSPLTPGESDQFTVRLKTGTVGTFTGDITFTTSDDNEAQFTIPIRGQVHGPVTTVFAVAPSSTIPFGPAASNVLHTRTFTVRNDGDQNLVLSDLAVTGNFTLAANFTATTLIPNAFATFDVRMTTSGSLGSRTGSVSFKTNDVLRPTFSFTVQGSVADLPRAEYPGVVRPNGSQFNQWLLDIDRDPAPELSLEYGFSTDIPIVGDWISDSQNITYAGVVRESNGKLLWLLDTDTDTGDELRFLFGVPGDVPVVGDFNNDGRDDFGVVRPGSVVDAATGRKRLEWKISTATIPTPNADGSAKELTQNVVVTYGLEGDTAIVGDWNGDGRDEVGRILKNTVVGSPRTWALAPFANITTVSAGLSRFNYGTDATFNFGLVPNPAVSSQTHLVGDWDGDGDDDAGIIEHQLLPGGGVSSSERRRWYLDINRDPHVDYDFRYGLPSDIPVAGIWKIPEATVLGPSGTDLAPLELNLGALQRGTSNATRSQTITLRNDGTSDLIGSLPASVGQFTVSPSGPFTIPSQGTLAITVTLKDSIAGAQSGTLSITTNDPSERTVAIKLVGSITGAIAIFPEVAVNQGTIDFGTVNQGVAAARTVTIRNDGNEPLIIGANAVSLIGGDFPIKRIEQPPAGSIPANGGFATFTLHMDASQFTVDTANELVPRTGTIQVITSDQRLPVRTFAVTGGVDVVNSQDIGVFRSTRWLLDTDRDPTNELNIRYGLAADRPVVGNWTGGNRDQLGVVRAGSNGLLEWLLDTDFDPDPEIIQHFGFPTDTPVVGDWDGNGTDDLGVVREETVTINGVARKQYTWFLNLDNDVFAEATYVFGVESADAILVKPVVGKWVQGDRRDHLAFITQERNPQGLPLLTWNFETNRPQDNGNANAVTLVSNTQAQYGLAGDQVVVGDWDGDNDSDVGTIGSVTFNGLMRWYLGRNESDPSINSGRPSINPHVDYQLDYGFPGDAPVVGQWLPPRIRPKVEGTVWVDDGDKIQEPGEPIRPGVTVFVDSNRDGELNNDERFTETDALGKYRFDDLLPGSSPIAIVTGPALGLKTVFPIDTRVTTTSLFKTLDPIADLAAQQRLTLSSTGDSGDNEFSTPLNTSGTGGVRPEDLVDLPQFRSDFEGIDGRGYSVVVIDSGIDLDHPAFGPDADNDGVGDRIIVHKTFVSGDTSTPMTEGQDTQGHGTHVSGIIAGESNFLGVAPGVDIIHLKVLGSGPTDTRTLEEALLWTVANAAVFNIVAVNLSLAAGNFSNPVADRALADEFAALEALRIITVAAAGNAHGPSTPLGVAYPAADPSVLAVGATYGAASSSRTWPTGATDIGPISIDEIAGFSQRSASLTDVFAPGVAIRGPALDGSVQLLSGTSQAAPFVTGAAVLIQQLAEERLGQRLTPAQFRELLRTTGQVIHDGDNEQGLMTRIDVGIDLHRLSVAALANAVLDKARLQSHVMNLAVSDVQVGNFGVQLVGASIPVDGTISGNVFGWASLSPEAKADTHIEIQQKFLETPPSPISVAIGNDGTFSRSNLPQGSYEVRLKHGSDVIQESPNGHNFKGIETATSVVSATGVTTIHLDGDARLDLAVVGTRAGSTSQALSTIELFRNVTPPPVNSEGQPPAFVADGTLTLPSNLRVPRSVVGWQQGSTNWLAVAAENDNTNQLRGAVVLYSRDSGSTAFGLSQSFVFNDTFKPRQMQLVDIDRDANQDVIVTNSSLPTLGQSAQLGLLRNSGASFSKLTFNTLGLAVHDLASTDLNGDGFVDLIVANHDGLVIHYGVAASANQLPFLDPIPLTDLGPAVQKVSVGDFNKDGRPDLVIGRGAHSDGPVSNWGVLLNQGVSTVPGRVAFSDLFQGGSIGGGSLGSAIPAIATLVASDLDGDGYADVAATLSGKPEMYVLFNEGVASGVSFLAAIPFEPSASIQGPPPAATIVANLNGDLQLDIVVANGHQELVNANSTLTQGYFDVYQNGLAAGTHLVALSPNATTGIADFTIEAFANAAPQVAASATISVLELTPPTTFIGTVEASDENPGQQGLTFSIVNATEGFPIQINSGNGQLTLRSSLDFESHPELTFEVQVKDSFGAARIQTVTIQVIDEPEVFEILANQWPESGGLTVSVESGRLLVSDTANSQVVVATWPMNQVEQLIVAGRVSSANHLTLQLSAGQLPLPIAGLFFTGGGHADDSLIVGGSLPITAVETAIASDLAGRTVMTWNQRSVVLTGVEHWVDNVTTANRRFTVNSDFASDVSVSPPASGELVSRFRMQLAGGDVSATIPELSASLPTSSNDDPISLTVTLSAANDLADFSNLPAMFLTVLGGAGNDLLIGSLANDRLEGGSGNDTLTGGRGNDTLMGSTGADSYLFAEATTLETDTLTELTNEGTADQLDFSSLSAAVSVIVDLSSTATTQLVHLNRNLIFSAANIENVIGGLGHDTLIGNLVANRLEGRSGNDTLTGASGNDTLVGGTGNDSLFGKFGDDVYVFQNETSTNERDVVTELSTEGTGDRLDFSLLSSGVTVDLSLGTLQVVFADFSLTISANTIENVTGGSGNDILKGTAAVNRLEGGPGNDQLVGRGGNDLYVFGLATSLETDSLIELATDGTGDQLDFSALPADVPITISLVGNAQTTLAAVHTNRSLIMIPESIESVIGGAGNDSLTGNKFNNSLDGRGGNDTLSGGLGNDSLDGGQGANTLTEFAATPNAINFVLTSTSLTGVGADKLLNLQTANLTGSTAKDTFTVSGWTGSGRLTGGGGTGDSVIATKNSGFLLSNSVLQSSDRSLNLALTGVSDASLTGGSGDDLFDLTGWTGTAKLIGGLGANKLSITRDTNFTLAATSLVSPSFGNLTLSQITVADLTGGSGNNTFNVSGWKGKGTLTGGGGIDTLVASRNVTTFALSDTRLITNVADNLDLALSDLRVANLTGSSGNDIFTVGNWTGSGSIHGGTGGVTDRIVVERDVDVTTLTNVSLISSGFGMLNLTGIETAQLLGGDSDNKLLADQFTLGSVTLRGGAGDDVLIGGSKKDSLDGGTGRDVLIGGLDSDTLIGGLDEDILIGGISSHSGNLSALIAIIAEWKRPDLDYASRVSNLRDSGVSSGTIKLDSASVKNDANAADRLNGSAASPNNVDLDWFFQSVGDALDAINGEIKTTL